MKNLLSWLKIYLNGPWHPSIQVAITKYQRLLLGGLQATVTYFSSSGHCKSEIRCQVGQFWWEPSSWLVDSPFSFTRIFIMHATMPLFRWSNHHDSAQGKGGIHPKAASWHSALWLGSCQHWSCYCRSQYSRNQAPHLENWRTQVYYAGQPRGVNTPIQSPQLRGYRVFYRQTVVGNTSC